MTDDIPTDETLPEQASDQAPDQALPDRLSTNPRNPYFDAAPLGRGIGILLNGEEKFNVDEYCVSEGWIRIAVGKAVDRKGNPMTIKLNGKVEPFFKDA
jgi:hypothetical protein